jgi:hypothetical protein
MRTFTCRSTFLYGLQVDLVAQQLTTLIAVLIPIDTPPSCDLLLFIQYQLYERNLKVTHTSRLEIEGESGVV